MGYPMGPKIAIAVRSNRCAKGPRRVPLPSNAAAGGVPSPAVARQRFATKPHRPSVGPTRQRFLLQPLQDIAHDGSFGYAGLLPVLPHEDLVFLAAAAPAGVRRRQAENPRQTRRQVHKSGASPGRFIKRRGLIRHAEVFASATAL